jgi:hypothetical protein
MRAEPCAPKAQCARGARRRSDAVKQLPLYGGAVTELGGGQCSERLAAPIDGVVAHYAGRVRSDALKAALR